MRKKVELLKYGHIDMQCTLCESVTSVSRCLVDCGYNSGTSSASKILKFIGQYCDHVKEKVKSSKNTS